jgi:hypothetical protein
MDNPVLPESIFLKGTQFLMKGFRRGILRVFTVVPLIAFLIFAFSALRAWGAGFVVTQPIVTEKEKSPETLTPHRGYAICALLVIIGFAGYLQKKDSRK